MLVWDNSSYHHIIFHILSFGDCFFVIFLYYLIILIMLITYFSTVFFNLVSLISLCASYLVHHLLWIVFIFFLNLVSPTSSCARRMGASTGSDFARWRPDWGKNVQNKCWSWSNNTLRLYNWKYSQIIESIFAKVVVLKEGYHPLSVTFTFQKQ